MLEELTPQALSFALLFVVVLTPPLALLLSALLLWRYRRAVLRAMALSSARLPLAGAAAAAGAAALPEFGESAATVPSEALRLQLRREPGRAATRIVLAGLVYALTMALALLIAFEPARTLPRFALLLWGAWWPVVPALALCAPMPLRTGLVATGLYLLPLLVALLAAWLLPTAAPPMFGGMAAAIRAAWSPPEVLRAWLVFNGVPTVLLWLVLNRWTRAVGPLVLAFSGVVVVGFIAGFLALATPRGVAVLDALARFSTLPASVVLVVIALLAIALGAALGAAALRRLRAGYVGKRSNDRSMMLDALWLVFATFHGTLFALVGLAWVAVAVVGWLGWRLTGRLLAALQRPAGVRAGHGLVFLRVFALGRRSEKLFDALTRQWRYAGSVQLITGPDLAHSTVQPHQWLDFLAGRLAGHFIADPLSLAQRIDGCDRLPDRDGLYRVNGLFCHADTWEAALLSLVAQGDCVLMDLRSFGEGNAGCSAELRHLVQRVPLARCVWVVDGSTDLAFLRRMLQTLWQQLPATSPNRGSDAGSAPLHHLRSGWTGLQALRSRLADSADAAAAG